MHFMPLSWALRDSDDDKFCFTPFATVKNYFFKKGKKQTALNYDARPGLVWETGAPGS